MLLGSAVVTMLISAPGRTPTRPNATRSSAHHHTIDGSRWQLLHIERMVGVAQVNSQSVQPARAYFCITYMYTDIQVVENLWMIWKQSVGCCSSHDRARVLPSMGTVVQQSLPLGRAMLIEPTTS